MIVRRTLDGAEKCALRDFLREEERAVSVRFYIFIRIFLRCLTAVDLGHFGGVWFVDVPRRSPSLVVEDLRCENLPTVGFG